MEKVSVIIPMYNSSKHILKCIDSVINQTYKELEIILIDDKSSDRTIKKIKSIKDNRIKVIKFNKNQGAASARNKGIEVSTGDYICFLDSDDYWKLDKIEKQLKFIKDKVFIYSKYEYLRGNKRHVANVPESLTYNQLLKNSAIFTSTVMLNMKVLSKEDIYMPNIKSGQDYGTWYKILKKIDKAYGMQEVLSVYRVGNKSLSSNKFKAMKRTWNLYKMEKIPFFKRLYCFICYGINAVKRRVK